MAPTAISTFMSFALRHRPDAVGIVLDAHGWTTTDSLLAAVRRAGHDVSLNLLIEVVEASDKRRFEFTADRTQIRASQGHSLAVDLGYEAKPPPRLLDHGTVARFLDSIRREGLQKRQRHHVHLSSEVSTAAAVGARRGEAVILQARSGEMHDLGHPFRVSPNGVWLADAIPVAFIDFPMNDATPQ